MLERAVAMLDVADQLLDAVLADEASGAAAIASIAQRTNVETLVLTLMPPLAWMNGASVGGEPSVRHYKAIK